MNAILILTKPLFAVVLMLLFFSDAYSQISASETEGCAPLVSVEFTQSLGALNGISWDFDDGTFSTLDAPTHTFQNSGVYVVSLTADGGVNEQITITVSESPEVNLTVVGDTEGCIPFFVQFEDATVPAPGTTLTDWSWDFGDGAVATGPNPDVNHTYSLSGINDVVLVVEDDNGCTGSVNVENLITVSDTPDLTFTSIPDNISVCNPPLSVSYNATASSNSPATDALEYLWEYGNSETSDASTFPDQTYTDFGEYPVSLTVTDDVGCVNQQALNAFIGSPQVDWTLVDGPTFCDTVYFVNNSDPSVTQINWGNGDFDFYNNGTVDTLMYVYTDPGDYTATLTTTSPGCSNSGEVDLTIEEVNVDFTSSPTSTCEPELDVTLVADSPNGEEFMWTFTQSDDTLYGETVDYTFSAEIDFDPYFLDPIIAFGTTLQVTTENGCVGEHFSIADSILPPSAWYAVDIYDGCSPLTVLFSDSSQSEIPLESWQFHTGDGSVFDFSTAEEFEEFEYTYNEPGEFQSFLVVENEFGCIDTSYFVNIYAGEPNGADINFSETEICPGDQIDFTAVDSDGSTDFWNIASDNSMLSGCITSPELSSTFSSYAGSHDVTVFTTNNGCIDQFTINDAIEVLGPVGHLAVIAQCDAPFVIDCNATITGATDWTFDFGDGNSFTSSTEQNVSHTYASTGDYTVTLTSNSDTGCPPFVETVLVHVRDVQAELTIDNLNPCLNDFQNQSEPVNLSAFGSQDVFATGNEGYLWHFGDGSGVPPFRTDVPSASVMFPQTGIYNLSLIAVDINGCTDTAFVDLEVGQVVADISADVVSYCLPFEVDFEDDSSSSGDIVSWSWNFDDGNFSFLENPNHVFGGGATANYTIELTVEDEFGCTDTDFLTLSPDIPTAQFFTNDNQICTDESTNLTPFVAGYVDYDWQIEGQPNSSDNFVSVSYDSAGQYDVSLTVTNANGCTNTETLFNFLSVQEYPDVDFISNVDGEDNLCYPILIEFTDVSDADIFAYRDWDLGTGFPVVDSETVGSIYDVPGTYVISLEVGTTFGCVSDYTETIEVEGPVALFSLSTDEICLGEDVTMQITDSSDVAYFSWDFGNGLDSAEVSPLTYNYNEYPQGGSTFIQLISWSNDSVCSASTQLPFQVNNTIADFNRNDEVNLEDTIHCFGLEDLFTSTSIDANAYVWSLGDGTTGPGETITHTYDLGGTYDITLEAYNTITGCADTIVKPITVYPEMVVGAPDQLECSYGTIQLSAFGGETYLWSPSGLVSDSTSINPTLLANENTELNVQITDTNNCSQTLPVLAEYIFEQPIPLWTDSVLTYGEYLNFEMPYLDYHIYTWTLGNGVECESCMYGFIPQNPDSFQVVVTDDLGCFQNTFNFNIDVLSDLIIYVPNSFTPNNDGINDAFYPVMTRAHIKDYEFTIFDRYGQEVWFTEDITEKWQGNHKDGTHYTQPEVFVWRIEVKDLKSIPFIYTGMVTVVR